MPVDSRSAARTWRRWLLGLLGVIALAGLGIGYRLWYCPWRDVERERALIRSAGQPVTLEELRTWYDRQPGDTELAREWLDVGKKLFAVHQDSRASHVPFVGADDWVPIPGNPWPNFERARQLLKDYAQPLDKLRELADRGGVVKIPFNFRDDYPLGNGTGEVDAIRRFCQLRTAVCAREGDWRGAAESIRWMLATEKAFAGSTNFHAAWMGASARHGVCDLLPLQGLSNEELREFEVHFEKSDLAGTLKTTLIIDRAWGEGRSSERFTLLDLQEYLPAYRECIAACELTPGSSSRAAADALSKVSDLGSGHLFPTQGSSFGFRDWLPNWSEFASRALVTARMRSAAIHCRIARFRQDRKRLPDSLGELLEFDKRPLPPDPITGGGMLFRKSRNAITVYGPGLDGKDDGGQVRPIRDVDPLDVGIAIPY